MEKAYKFRIYPNKKQEELIKKILLATAGLQLIKTIIELITTIIKSL